MGFIADHRRSKYASTSPLVVWYPIHSVASSFLGMYHLILSAKRRIILSLSLHFKDSRKILTITLVALITKAILSLSTAKKAMASPHTAMVTIPPVSIMLMNENNIATATSLTISLTISKAIIILVRRLRMGLLSAVFKTKKEKVIKKTGTDTHRHHTEIKKQS